MKFYKLLKQTFPPSMKFWSEVVNKQDHSHMYIQLQAAKMAKEHLEKKLNCLIKIEEVEE